MLILQLIPTVIRSAAITSLIFTPKNLDIESSSYLQPLLADLRLTKEQQKMLFMIRINTKAQIFEYITCDQYEKLIISLARLRDIGNAIEATDLLLEHQ